MLGAPKQVDYTNWEDGQPDNSVMTGTEAFNTGGETGDEERSRRKGEEGAR